MPNFKGNKNSVDAPVSVDGSSVWSSPNIGQMTEMSQEWYRKVINDSAEQFKMSFDSQYNGKQLDFSTLISHSQPNPRFQSNFHRHNQTIEDPIFPFNSFPECIQTPSNDFSDFPDLPDIHDLPELSDISNYYSNPRNHGKLFTPDQSSNNQSRSHSFPHSVLIGASPIKKLEIKNQTTRGRKYQNSNLLAQFCQILLNSTAHPNLNQIADFVYQLKSNSSNSNNNSSISEKKLRSAVREWFRKRREYMATKIYRSCQRLLPKEVPKDQNISDFLKSVHSNETIIGIIMLEAKLPMQYEKEKIDFVKEKITDFYLKYPQRKLRNTNFVKQNTNEFLLNGADDDGEERNLSKDNMDRLIIK